MIRALTILLVASILTVHVTVLNVQAGSVWQYALAKNFLLFFLGARWLSSFIGVMANILLSKDEPDENAEKKEIKKIKREIPAEAFSEASFPTAAQPLDSAKPQAANDDLVDKAPATTIKPEAQRDNSPAVWRFRGQKQLGTRVLQIRG